MSIHRAPRHVTSYYREVSERKISASPGHFLLLKSFENCQVLINCLYDKLSYHWDRLTRHWRWVIVKYGKLWLIKLCNVSFGHQGAPSISTWCSNLGIIRSNCRILLFSTSFDLLILVQTQCSKRQSHHANELTLFYLKTMSLCLLLHCFSSLNSLSCLQS